MHAESYREHCKLHQENGILVLVVTRNRVEKNVCVFLPLQNKSFIYNPYT